MIFNLLLRSELKYIQNTDYAHCN